MGEENRVKEPAVDSFSDDVLSVGASEPPFEGISIFNLSGGIMKTAAKTANRVDGLLAKMLVQPRTGKYVADIDKNLDFLFTSLQLDMINIAADVSSEEERIEPVDEIIQGSKVKLELGPPFHDDSRES